MLLLNRKQNAGYLVAEIGPILWITFMFFTLPLIMLGSLGLRYSLLMSAVYSTAASASQCRSFSTDTSSSEPSATTLVSQNLKQTLSTYSGITLNRVDSYIVICPLNSSSCTKQTTPLAAPADTSANAYNLEIVAQASINPLMIYPSKGIFGDIPGLTSPLSVQAKADSFFENTQGLTQ